MTIDKRTEDYTDYLKRLKQIIKLSLAKYFDPDGKVTPSTIKLLKPVLIDVGLEKYYVKFHRILKVKSLGSPVNYETLEQLSQIDYANRSALQIRDHLLGNPSKRYDEMDRNELIDMIISLKSQINKQNSSIIPE